MYVCSYGHKSWLDFKGAGGVQWRNRAFYLTSGGARAVEIGTRVRGIFARPASRNRIFWRNHNAGTVSPGNGGNAPGNAGTIRGGSDCSGSTRQCGEEHCHCLANAQDFYWE